MLRGGRRRARPTSRSTISVSTPRVNSTELALQQVGRASTESFDRFNEYSQLGYGHAGGESERASGERGGWVQGAR